MPPTLVDVLSLLDTIESYAAKGTASCQYVKDTFNDMPIRKAHIQGYDELEQLCTKLGLVSVGGDSISITPLGEKIHRHHSAQDPKLTDVFVSDVIMGPGVGETMRSALAKFCMDSYGAYSYPKEEIYGLFAFPAVMSILYEAGLLKKDGTRVIISSEYAGLVPGKITQEQVEDQLWRQRQVGAMGEEIALAFEKARLTRMGCSREAASTRLISAEFANAGYDMESFDRDEDGKVHRIYVEVKSSTGNEIDFYWSTNEIKKAKTHASDYWIYFVPGVDERTKKSSGDPIRLQDPYKTIFNNPSFRTESSQYHVLRTKESVNNGSVYT